MNVNCIFFDFDGVLAESVNIKTEAFKSMYLHHGEEFAQRVVAHHIDNGGVSRFEKFKIYNGQWLGETINDEIIQQLAHEYSEIVLDKVTHCKEVNGATSLLEAHPNITKYIITGTPTEEIRIILERRKMSHYFEDAFGSPPKKDHWVKELIATNNLKPDECVFVGDALADYEAAVKNKVPFILRETPECEHLFSNFSGPRVKDMAELHTLLQEAHLKVN